MPANLLSNAQVISSYTGWAKQSDGIQKRFKNNKRDGTPMFRVSGPAHTSNCNPLSSTISIPVYGPACLIEAVNLTTDRGSDMKSFMNRGDKIMRSLSVVQSE